jgi:hypothetical protein
LSFIKRTFCRSLGASSLVLRRAGFPVRVTRVPHVRKNRSQGRRPVLYSAPSGRAENERVEIAELRTVQLRQNDRVRVEGEIG